MLFYRQAADAIAAMRRRIAELEEKRWTAGDNSRTSVLRDMD